jgi:acetyltransferase
MSIRNLEALFQPQSIAVIGASDRPGSVGSVVLRNLKGGGFKGSIWPVNPRHATIDAGPAWPDVASLPEIPDLAVICTPAHTVPDLVAELGRKGARAAIVMTAGLKQPASQAATTLEQAMLAAARPHLLRILGPNFIGVLVPGLGLNASFAPGNALPGKLAFVTQSGALATAMLDWANGRGIGFSHFISLGDSADVDFGDLLDYLGSDPGTRAILMYAESVKAGRKFMSAARAAARNKPVIVVKAGRAPDGARAAASHTGALTWCSMRPCVARGCCGSTRSRRCSMPRKRWRTRTRSAANALRSSPTAAARACWLRTPSRLPAASWRSWTRR